jgi:hypothetical protein
MTESPGDKRQEPQNSEKFVAGEWVTPPLSYVDPARRFCALCGRPIARRYWRVGGDGNEMAFCDPGHAARYATYPKRTR